ncbi:hypothetical protein LB464_12690 [Escherichia coli]|nr:hypothetical protein [Escherichia coli]
MRLRLPSDRGRMKGAAEHRADCELSGAARRADADLLRSRIRLLESGVLRSGSLSKARARVSFGAR